MFPVIYSIAMAAAIALPAFFGIMLVYAASKGKENDRPRGPGMVE